jgi:hypothetical protein
MKNYLIKGISLSLFFIGINVFSFSQQKKTTEPVTVVKSKKTTDPNYEKNIEKSKKAQANFNRKPVSLVKDEKYYLTNIDKLKKQIKLIETSPNQNGVNADKLQKYKTELNELEKEFIEFKNNQK